MMEKDHHGERKGGCEVSGWTTSYRWAPVRREKVRGLVNHHARDVDAQHGREVSHSNEGIVAERTRLNVTMVNDGNGGFVECTDSKQWTEYLDSRLDEVGHTWRTQKDGSRKPVALRKDAAVAVDYVLQLDPEFTGSAESLAADPEKNEEVRRLLAVMVDEVVEQHGQQNVVGWTLHLDEENPHIQMLAIPEVDGCTSYKQFFGDAEPGKRSTRTGSQKAYAARHDSMRTRLRSEGYEATFERVAEGLEHVPLAKYKTSKDKRRAEREDMDAREAAVEVERAQLVETAEAVRVADEQARARLAAADLREQRWKEQKPARLERAKEQGRQAYTEGRREKWEEFNAAVHKHNEGVRQLRADREQLNQDREQLNQDRQAFEQCKQEHEAFPLAVLRSAYTRGAYESGPVDVARCKVAEFKEKYPTVDAYIEHDKQRREEAKAKNARLMEQPSTPSQPTSSRQYGG